MSFYWYTLHVKPHKEQPVSRLLIAENFSVFYPALRVEPVNPRARKERPFFPGYMFVYLDLDEKGNNILRWIEGTHGLVEFGGVPARVPDNLIRELKQRLETIRKAGGLVDVDLKKGDPVRIVDGILEGYEAIFDDRLSGKNRVQVLLSFLSDQPKRVQLGSSQIKKLNH